MKVLFGALLAILLLSHLANMMHTSVKHAAERCQVHEASEE